MKEFIKKYDHILSILYLLIYLPWFVYVEEKNIGNINIIEANIDDKIPFCEFFIIPYFLWFFYIAITFVIFFFKDKKEYLNLCTFTFIGMTLFLIISTIYPNGHLLRPTFFKRDNIFVDMVKVLYTIDTSTNIFPSIHVFNSIAAHLAIKHTTFKKNDKKIKTISFILMFSIILSTMFLKQHSFYDVLGGITLSIILDYLIYGKKIEKEKLNFKH